MNPAPASQSPVGPPPYWKQMKFAGNGPATSSENATRSGIVASFANSAPPASCIVAAGLERSIVVAVRRPLIEPIEHELGPSETYSESLGNV